jgi:hypothetical protein
LKIEKRLFDDSTPLPLKEISAHWKFIIEVITCKKELLHQCAKILLYFSKDSIKCKGKEIFFKKYVWNTISQDKLMSELVEIKIVAVTECVKILNNLRNACGEKGNVVDMISNKLKQSLSFKISKNFINTLLLLVKRDPNLEENLIGDKFINDVIEFTNDKKSYGVTTSILHEAREKWIKNNPEYININSYPIDHINNFGKMVQKYKIWETSSVKRITVHLGIKLKNI